jgi:hypothetical protein
MLFRTLATILLSGSLLWAPAVSQVTSNPPAEAGSKVALPSVLTAVETEKILPPSVFFQGLSASIQGRNSGGVRLEDKKLILVTLVDTSGYSSAVQNRYQAYLITESAIEVDGHTLPAGAYGCGFLSDDTFVVMDIGGHDLFVAHSTNDTSLRRPRPLQVQAAPDAPGSYRLYTGRKYVTFKAKS